MFVFSVVRALVPRMSLDELFEQKGEVAKSVLEELEKVMESFPVFSANPFSVINDYYGSLIFHYSSAYSLYFVDLNCVKQNTLNSLIGFTYSLLLKFRNRVEY